MTTLTFNLSRAISRSWQPGDEVIVTLLDHAANVSPWEAAAEERGVRIHYAPITDEALLDTEQLCRLVNDKTRLIAVTCASNLLGSKVDVERIISAAHKHQALVFLDAVHLLPHMQVDVRALNCDFLVGSVYKFFGPHLGVAFGKKEHLNAFQPYKIKPIAEVSPQRWETGTQSFEAVAGALATVNYIASLGSGASRQEKLASAYEHILAHENHLAALFLERIAVFSGVRVLGINDPQRVSERTPTFALHFDHHSAFEVARYFSSRNTFVGAGKFHANQLIEACGFGDTDIVRVGFTHYHSEGDIAYFFEVLSSLLSR